MAFLSPGDLCGIETKFMCIFSILSLSFLSSLCLFLCVVVFGVFHFTTQAPVPPPPNPLSPNDFFPFAFSLVSIIISCVSLHFHFHFAFVSCLISIFLFFIIFYFFLFHFWPLPPQVWAFLLFFFPDFRFGLLPRAFFPNAALGNCVWNREMK